MLCLGHLSPTLFKHRARSKLVKDVGREFDGQFLENREASAVGFFHARTIQRFQGLAPPAEDQG